MSELYLEKPADFEEKIPEGTAVFMECEQKLLLLHRARCEISPGSWGTPGGKIEKGETPLEGLIREIWEEIQLRAHPEDLQYLRSLYLRHSKVNYRLHIFRWKLSSFPQIVLDPKEHTDYRWQPIAELSHLPLIEGGLETFQLVYGMK